MVTTEIQITSLLPITLDTREGATRLAHAISRQMGDGDTLILDFQGVVFMSRSFADQLHKELNLSNAQLNLVFKNAEVGIVEMLEAVAKTQTERRPINKSYRVLSFNNLINLQDYCYAW